MTKYIDQELARYITILENASEDELQKYRDELEYWQNEKKKYWPVSPELLTQYEDGTHTVKTSVGTVYWRNKNNQLHRDEDKPAWISADGTLEWYQNGLCHRDRDLPAIIRSDGELMWLQNGKLHRSRGPAVIYLSGRHQWWINNKTITKEVNEWLDGEEWHGTPLQIFEFQLRFL